VVALLKEEEGNSGMGDARLMEDVREYLELCFDYS